MRIYKYKVEPADPGDGIIPGMFKGAVSIPKNARILDVKYQSMMELYLWAMVDPSENLTETVLVHVFGTGQDLPNDMENFHYLKTDHNSPPYVWHYFVEIES